MEPSSFDGDWYDEWSLWVLDHGLPALPDALGQDDAVPVARWVGAEFGAVLFVDWGGDPDDEEGLYLSSEVEVFRRVPAGWEAASTGGGGGWFDPPFVRPDVPRDYAVVAHFHDGGGSSDRGQPSWSYASAYGFTGSAAHTVEVEDETSSIQRPIESPLGVFIVVADAAQRAVVRVRNVEGEVLAEQQFSPPTALAH